MKVFASFTDVEDMKPCRKKPIVVHAKQINEHFDVKTLEGIMRGNPGDYLMRGVDGEMYPCKKDIFERTYCWLDEESI
jgi:hypothetical protein